MTNQIFEDIHESNFGVNPDVYGLVTIARLARTPQEAINYVRKAQFKTYGKVGTYVSNMIDIERTE